MRNRVYARQDSFDAYLLDIFPDLISCLILGTCSVIVNVLQDRGKASLVADVVLFFILVLNEAISFFVDSIVCQMHAKIVQVASHWTVVLLCREPGQAFFVDEAAQWVDSGDQNIYPQIKLETID